jgi:oligogalacturonide lyase
MRPPRFPWTRRRFLFSGAAVSGLHAEKQNGGVFPAEFRRHTDPATEFEVLRLTDPAHAAHLPAYYGRSISRRNSFLLYSSDRLGPPQAFQMDLKNGESRELTQVEDLDTASLTLVPDDRAFCYFHGTILSMAALHNPRHREIYRVPEGWERAPGFSVSDDGVHALFGETRQGQARLRAVHLRTGAARSIVETDGQVRDPLARPRRAQVLYRQADGSLWLVNLDGQQNRRLRAAEGRIGPANWAPDGRTVLYLLFPNDPAELNSIRELTPDQNTDKLVSRTSQFAHFGFNSNTSVFVGASLNRASPTILLLLRVARRELTLCEHRSSDPASVAPVFSPDSQRIYFQSDRDGKSAIYRVAVEKLVEKTEPETS